MSERPLIELLRGKGAHADPLACVEDLSAELAARQVAGFPHSVGQLVFHMNYWMSYELRRIRGRAAEVSGTRGGEFSGIAFAGQCGGVGWAEERLRMVPGAVRGASEIFRG